MIIVNQNSRDFEYDIHSLVKAFYPTEDVVFNEEGGSEITLRISVFYEKNQIRICLLNAEGSILDEQCTPLQETEPGPDGKTDARPRIKNALKALLYTMLSRYTGSQLPWGNLTGIRPVKIPMDLLQKGYSREEILPYMEKTYFISPSRASLACDIAVRERDILTSCLKGDGYSLYIGIPFCPTICLYCSFSSSPIGLWRGRVDAYLEALYREIDAVSEMFAGKTLQSVYIGGGTPTTLLPEQMDALISYARSRFDFSGVLEFTVEAGRPDTITEPMLAVLKRHGVSRISINPQTMNQETLDLIGRHHTVEQIREAYGLARSMGFDNINMDLIVGLPGEDLDEVRYTMEQVIAMNPEDVTVHSLALKRAARLSRMRDVYEKISFHNNNEIMDMTTTLLSKAGLAPYYLYRQKNMAGNFENVGYAAAGKEGLYNILIMEEVQSIAALGAGTVTKRVYDNGLIERCDNVKDVEQYISRIDEMIERKRKLFGFQTKDQPDVLAGNVE